MTLVEAKKYIDSFSRPQGFNIYSWRAVKKMAFGVWQSYIQGKRQYRTYNFMCREFYEMTCDLNGQSILSKRRVHCHYPEIVGS